MTHDELCKSNVDPPLGMVCDGCELIAHVVLRERERAALDPRSARRAGYVLGVRDAVARAEELHDIYAAADLTTESDAAWRVIQGLRGLLEGDTP